MRRKYVPTVIDNFRNPLHSNIFTDRFRKYFLAMPRASKPFNEIIRNNSTVFGKVIPQLLPSTILPPPWPMMKPYADTTLTKSNNNSTKPTIVGNEFRKTIKTFQDLVVLYMDTSENEAGSERHALITSENQLRYKLPPLTTIFTAEMFALNAELITLTRTKELIS